MYLVIQFMTNSYLVHIM